MTARCAACRFWVSVNGAIGDCRNAPPSIVGRTVEWNQANAEWPRTFPDQWCGRYEAKATDISREEPRAVRGDTRAVKRSA